MKLHKNARLSLFVEIGGVLYPQSTTSIANNGARSYLKNLNKHSRKKNNQTDQKSPYFFVAPFSSPTLYISIITHTHQYPIKRCFDQSDMIFTSFWIVIFDSWNRESIRGHCAILYQRRALLCKYFSPQILQKNPHSWVVDAPPQNLL